MVGTMTQVEVEAAVEDSAADSAVMQESEVEL